MNTHENPAYLLKKTLRSGGKDRVLLGDYYIVFDPRKKRCVCVCCKLIKASCLTTWF